MFRAATPGTILALVALILLLLVTINVPILKSLYFLQATIGGTGSQNGQQAKFGTLGFCIESTCSSAKLGYKFNPNQLLGISFSGENLSSAITKWLTYTLVTHPIALGLAGITVVLGVLGHVGDMRMTCLTTTCSFLAAVIAIAAFGLDMALFIIARKRINDVNGAFASLGNAIWMTLAAAVLLFASGIMFCVAGCAPRRRDRVKDDYYGQRPIGDNYGEQMRMEALAAEEDRKRRQAQLGPGGGDLPKFAEYETEYEVPFSKDNDYDGSNANQSHAYSDAQSGFIVPGVGPGYGPRREYANAAPAAAQFAPMPINNAAGHGAHAQRAPSVGPAMPMPHDNMYTPGAGPQPYRDDSLSPAPRSDYNHYANAAPAVDRYANSAPVADQYASVAPSVEDPYSSVAAATAPATVRRQATGEYGHPTEYSGGTFGGNGGVRNPRALPALPVGNPNDGFGLTSQHTSCSETHASEDGYDRYASSAYGHQASSSAYGHQKLGTHYEDARDTAPPVYESGYGKDTYPREKH